MSQAGPLATRRVLLAADATYLKTVSCVWSKTDSIEASAKECQRCDGLYAHKSFQVHDERHRDTL
jgi:hypothetical protein